MCGIITIINKTKKNIKINERIIDLYEDQYQRGEEGFGIIRIDKNRKIKIERACEPYKFLIDLKNKNSDIIIAHHRYPTSTPNKLNQTHPMVISNKIFDHDYLVIHNGIINNDKELKEKHEKIGIKYETEYIDKLRGLIWNDSEAIANEIALYIENKIPEIRTTSQAALVILQINKKNKKAEKIYYTKIKNAVLTKNIETKNYIELSSEGLDIDVEQDKLIEIDIRKKNIKEEVKDIKARKEDLRITGFEEKKESVIDRYIREAEEEKTKKEKEEKTIKRIWTNENEKIEIKINESEIDKNYKDRKIEEFKKITRLVDSYEIKEELETILDIEYDKILEMLIEYIERLKVEKIETQERQKYFSNIFKIMKTMSDITDEAEEIQKEKELDEEIDLYNKSFEKNQNEEENREEYFKNKIF